LVAFELAAVGVAWTHRREKLPDLFDWNREAKISTWRSSAQLQISCVLAAPIVLRHRSRDRGR